MKKTVVLATVSAFVLTGCNTAWMNNDAGNLRNSIKGGTAGAAAGALAGLVYATVANKDARSAALIGAGLGGLTGAGVGAYMDQQEEALRSDLADSGVTVSRQGNEIVLNMPSSITFGVNQDQIEPQFMSVLASVVSTMHRYPQTLIDIYGHTDASGSEQYNMDLSSRRAMSVANHISGNGIDPRRIYVTGYGETQPVASNSTEAGKAANRRVEIKISPLT